MGGKVEGGSKEDSQEFMGVMRREVAEFLVGSSFVWEGEGGQLLAEELDVGVGGGAAMCPECACCYAFGRGQV